MLHRHSASHLKFRVEPDAVMGLTVTVSPGPAL